MGDVAVKPLLKFFQKIRFFQIFLKTYQATTSLAPGLRHVVARVAGLAGLAGRLVGVGPVRLSGWRDGQLRNSRGTIAFSHRVFGSGQRAVGGSNVELAAVLNSISTL